MRILFVLPTAKMYGDNIAIMNIIPSLIVKGIEPLFLVRKDSDIETILNKNGYHTVTTSNWLMTCYKLRRNKIKSFLRFIKGYVCTYIGLMKDKELLKQLKKFSPAIIYTNNSLCLTGYFYSRKLNVRHLFHIREYVDKDADMRFWPSKSSFISRLKSINNYNITITNEIKDYFGLVNNTIVVYDGVIKKEDKPYIHSNKQKFFLYVGRLTYTKGVSTIIEAFCDFCQVNYNYELLIAGDGEEKESYVTKTKEFGIQDKVKFLGYRNDVNRLMADATALIVASRYEAFGFITAEAMYNGCVVIGKNTGGTAEQLNNMDKNVQFLNSFRFISKDELVANMLKATKITLSEEQLIEMSNQINSYYSVTSSSNGVYNFLLSIVNNGE